MSFDEISLANRVLNLRESAEDGAAFRRSLSSELSFSEGEANAVATVLEDRFISPNERLDLLGRLELNGSLETGSTVGGFIGHLAGADGEEATRRHACALAQRLASTSIDGERAAVSRESIAEL
ncbi:MAG TPA: hypothetical protein VJP40_06300, partial [bacterium]|nr:hypothetical protein [bacterium]